MTTNTTITPELLDQLLANYERPEDLTGDGGLFKQLKKALIERALGAELTDHLGYEKGDPAGRGKGNSRNGTSSKTVLTEDGEVEIAVPRDRAGSFEPQLIAKGQTRFDGFDDKILSLYARGMTVREIQGHVAELYGTEVSPDLISRVTDAVIDEVREWQNRPLDPVYPVVFIDAINVKIRDGNVANRPIYIALGVTVDGTFVELTRTEYQLLELLMVNPRRVLPHGLIYDRVWGYDFGANSNSLEVYIGYLRRKTEASGEPRLLHTVRGVGYVLRSAER